MSIDFPQPGKKASKAGIQECTMNIDTVIWSHDLLGMIVYCLHSNSISAPFVTATCRRQEATHLRKNKAQETTTRMRFLKEFVEGSNSSQVSSCDEALVLQRFPDEAISPISSNLINLSKKCFSSHQHVVFPPSLCGCL